MKFTIAIAVFCLILFLGSRNHSRHVSHLYQEALQENTELRSLAAITPTPVLRVIMVTGTPNPSPTLSELDIENAKLEVLFQMRSQLENSMNASPPNSSRLVDDEREQRMQTIQSLQARVAENQAQEQGIAQSLDQLAASDQIRKQQNLELLENQITSLQSEINKGNLTISEFNRQNNLDLDNNIKTLQGSLASQNNVLVQLIRQRDRVMQTTPAYSSVAQQQLLTQRNQLSLEDQRLSAQIDLLQNQLPFNGLSSPQNATTNTSSELEAINRQIAIEQGILSRLK